MLDALPDQKTESEDERQRNAPYPRLQSPVPMQTSPKHRQCERLQDEVGLENNPASRRRVPVKCQEIPHRTLFPSQDRTQTSNASIVRDVRDFQLRPGIGHMVPLVCDFVVPREKQGARNSF